MKDIRVELNDLDYARERIKESKGLTALQKCRIFDAIDGARVMLKEQEEQKRKWLKSIADNQIANAPTDMMDEKTKEHFYGVWCGLEIAYGILTEES